MSIILKILLAVASIIFCVASVYATCKVWKRRLSYHGSQDEMFESIS